MMMDPDALRQRFAALGVQKASIVERVAPLRAQYEPLLAQQMALDVQMRPLLDQIKAIEAPLFAIEQERAMICRALAGKTETGA